MARAENAADFNSGPEIAALFLAKNKRFLDLSVQIGR
jgi:hypothetical protein